MQGQSVSIGVPSVVGEAAEFRFTIASQFFLYYYNKFT